MRFTLLERKSPLVKKVEQFQKDIKAKYPNLKEFKLHVWEDFDNKEIIWLDKIVGRFVSSFVMQELKDLADREGVDIGLRPDAIYGTNIDTLKEWYRFHGFETMKEDPVFMIRKGLG